MHKPESVLENETHKILKDFEIQMNHLIMARRPDQAIVNKKENLPNCAVYIYMCVCVCVCVNNIVCYIYKR